MTNHAHGVRREHGSVSIEFAIVMGAVLVSFVTLMVTAGRILQQENDVRSAAHSAARAASLRDTFGDATNDARRVAGENLADSGVSCVGGGVTTIISSSSDFTPGDGFVTVRVECTARLVGAIGLGPTNVFAYDATEVIDSYRGEP